MLFPAQFHAAAPPALALSTPVRIPPPLRPPYTPSALLPRALIIHMLCPLLLPLLSHAQCCRLCGQPSGSVHEQESLHTHGSRRHCRARRIYTECAAGRRRRVAIRIFHLLFSLTVAPFKDGTSKLLVRCLLSGERRTCPLIPGEAWHRTLRIRHRRARARAASPGPAADGGNHTMLADWRAHSWPTSGIFTCSFLIITETSKPNNHDS